MGQGDWQMIPSLDESVFVDFETKLDRTSGYSLSKMATYDYVMDERFDILSVSIAEGNGTIDFYHKYGANGGGLDTAKERLARYAGEKKSLVAHNANFEGMILKYRWNTVFNSIADTTSYLRYKGVKASLDNGARLVGLEKMDAPNFDESSLRNDTSLRKLATYNAMDVLILRDIFKLAIQDRGYIDLEWYISHRTAMENLKGICVDRALAMQLADEYARQAEKLQSKLCEEHPDFDTSKLKSPQKVTQYCSARYGIDFKSTSKKDITVIKARAKNKDLDRFFALKTSIGTLDNWSKKLRAIANKSGRIYCALTHYGAHTGRFTASGIESGRINIQNLPKGDGDLPELAEYRKILCSDAGKNMVVSDLSTIEPRIIALLAGQADLIRAFEAGRDIYIWFGGLVFPGEEIVKGGKNGHLRNLSKEGLIGLGYGMGQNRFVDTVQSKILDADIELIKRVFIAYRQKFRRIVGLKRDMFKAFGRAVQNGSSIKVGRCLFRRVNDFQGTGPSVEVVLPTGRSLFYRYIAKKREYARFNGTGKYILTFWYTHRLEIGPDDKRLVPKQTRRKLTPSTLIENIVQAVARDILIAQQREIEAQFGLRVLFSVHDELIIETDECECPRRNDSIPDDGTIESNHEVGCPWIEARKVVMKMMSKPPSCFPELKDLPVACELSDTIRERYGK